MSRPSIHRATRSNAQRSPLSPEHPARLIGSSVTTLLLAHAALAAGVLPQGGHYVAGSGTIAVHGNTLTVTQPCSTRGVIDWSGFSIGTGNTVAFDNGSGATLNRVTTSARSVLLGSLQATGRLYLINPQGIVVGRGGVVSTGGRFVASTLDLPDAAFMSGGTLTLAGSSNGDVVNLGKITSSGGDVLLIARRAVVNDGSVSAPNGTVELVAAQQTVLYQSTTNRQVYVQSASHGTVVDRGLTEAAQINLEAADGNIYALAGGGSRIRATGTALRDAHVWLVADDGHVTQRGTIAANDADGSGGIVDTRANTLTLGDTATVQAGRWNVSTPEFTLNGAVAGAFNRSLNARTSVDATATGTHGASGDLDVGSNLDWQGPASLSLVAFRNVSIAPGTTIRNTGSVTNRGTIDWSASTGTVSAFYDMNGRDTPGRIVAHNAWSAPEYSGLVTQVTAYKLINSLADLDNVALDLNGVYALGTDVDAHLPSGKFFAPIGSFPSSPFTGQFDGLGHAISNLAIGAPPSSEIDPGVGLFADIGLKGVVRNLTIRGSVTASAADNGFYGILAGLDDGGTIVSVHVSGSVVVENAQYVGGLVGWSGSGGPITRSSSDARIDSGMLSFAAGGLIGYNGGEISQSFATGSVSGNGIGVGGLAGINGNTLTQSYSTGTVTVPAKSMFGGALVGQNLYDLVEQSFATGRVDVPGGGGGIAGYNYGPVTIASDVYWDTQTTGASVAVRAVADNSQFGNARGLTTAQMSNPASFGPTYDFSPSGVWAMPAGATHPVLRWQLAH